MKKLRIIGMAFVVALALSAIVASTAMAGEYGRCVKLETSTGRYENAGCTKTSPSKHGKYEWHAGPGAKPGYTSTTGEAILKSAAGKIECTASTDAGKITGPFTDVDTVTFTGCTTKVGEETVKCQNTGNTGTKEGTIKTNLLDTKLIDHGTKGLSGLEPKEGEVWNEFVSSEHEPYQAEFECGGKGSGLGELFRISGSLSGVVTPVNTMSLTSTTTFTATTGEQDLKLEYSTNGGGTWNGPLASEELTKGTATFEELIEVMACNEKTGEPPPVCS